MEVAGRDIEQIRGALGSRLLTALDVEAADQSPGDREKEVAILRARVPGASEVLAREIGRFLQALRARRLMRRPGVAESIDWAQALVRLHLDHLDPAAVKATLGCIVKDRRDQRDLDDPELSRLVAEATAAQALAS
jgi:hypothetical protein